MNPNRKLPDLKELLPFALLALVAFILTGCQAETPDSLATPDRAAVSSIPWNKPASWEGAGALGGFMPQGGH